MTEPAPENRAFSWSVLFFRELFKQGVSQVVVSPGSRSTPLTLAAASHKGFRKHIVLDERSAAFTALGIAKATGNPAVLICTSGTALANYYPAVIEARLSGIPLILATADRPPHLRSTGANQSIDQINIFGNYAVFSHEVGEPCFEDEDIARLKMLADQAVNSSITQKGPVHLNFPFRKPLEPEPAFVTSVEQQNLSDSNIRNQINSSSALTIPVHVKELIENSDKPLIVAGPLANNSAAKTAEELGRLLHAPVISEGGFASEQCIQGYEGFLRDKKAQQKFTPDLILRFGFQPTGKAVEQALQVWKDVPHVHFASTGSWHDATYSVTHRVDWQERPVRWDMEHRTNDKWISRWRSAEEKFFAKAEGRLTDEPLLTDLHIHHYLSPQIPERWNVFLSNSFPVRDSLMMGRYQTPSIFVNRGASGIDGITSTAMGINLALGQPTILFTGDLAFLHDTNALLSNRLLSEPMVVVVLNNRGGNVFRMLPIAEHGTYYRDYFETPQSARLSAMAETYGLPYSCVSDKETLKSIDLVGIARSTGKGIHIVECKTDSAASMKLRNLLWSRDYAT